MDRFNYLLSFLVLWLNLMSLSIYAQDVCEKQSSCICVFPNGTGIDLTPASKTYFASSQIYEDINNGAEFKLSTYYYHPCFDILFQSNTTINSTCDKKLALCRHVNVMRKDPKNATYTLDGGVYDYMGSSYDLNFTSDGKSIVYINGPSKTIMLLVCAETDDELHIQSLTEPKEIKLAFYSRYACLQQVKEIGRSVGSTLCIVFLTCVLFYLALGICTRKFLMGATGLEVIPNLGFWTGLPGLVKDGVAFASSGCKIPPRSNAPTTSPDPNSYDSI